MKIFQYEGESSNFGDALNTWLWPRLMPGFFDENDATHFIGIGSTLGMTELPGEKIIFGTGFVPHYHAKPDMSSNDWNIYFVRGPRTAARLGLDAKLSIADSGILARSCIDTRQYKPTVVSFMPHWESMARGSWKETCAEAGINLIDPRRPVTEVIRELLRSKLVLAEAMHGAIIADALRIPWVPVAPINAVHRDKWYDWSESMQMTLRPEMLRPSQLAEFGKSNFSRAASTTIIDAAHSAPSEAGDTMSLLTRSKRTLEASPWAGWVNTRMMEFSAAKLMRMSRMPGYLSEDVAMERVTVQMLEKLDQLQRDYHYTRYQPNPALMMKQLVA